MSQFTYAVDLVICIDSTGSMSSIIERVKSNALRFHDDLKAALDVQTKYVDILRIKVLSFRDYYDTASNAMVESPFYKLPDEQKLFSDFVNGIGAEGGGDAPENGLEALARAICSDWTNMGNKRRHVIVIWTDSSAHSLEDSRPKPSNYPQNIPRNFDELTDLWEDGQGSFTISSKRLVIFAPDSSPWTEIFTRWSNVIHTPSRAGEGLSDVDYRDILNAIAGSV